MKASELVIGVDGGGTKTVACLAIRDKSTVSASGSTTAAAAAPTIVGRGTAGPSNIRAVGESTATSNIDEAITAAFDDASIDRSTVAGACLGLAGADRDEERVMFGEWADHVRLAKFVRIVNDAIPVLYAGAPDGCGIALIAGTGSLAFGRNSAGATARCGGWGYLLGDEGSGYAIALAGLRAASRFADGRGPSTCLLDLFLRHFDLAEPAELIPTIYTETVDRTTIASWSRVVFQACDARDEQAIHIVRQSARELAEMVRTITRTLALPASIPLALTGGILLNHGIIREFLEQELAASQSHSYSLTTVPDPVVGAIRLAVD